MQSGGTAAGAKLLRLPARVTSVSPGVVIAIWLGVIAAAALWGWRLRQDGVPTGLGAPPLVGAVDPETGIQALIPIVLAVALVWGAPRIAARLRWNALLLCSFAGALVWAVALALARGSEGLVGPVELPTEYLREVTAVGAPGDFLAGFADRIGEGHNVHVRGHPPAMLLLLWGLAELGLGGSWPAALLMVALGASVVPAALLALRELAGEEPARRAAPFLVVVPAALWVATTADALFAGVGAWGVTLVVLATGRRDGRGDALALAGGLLLGLSIFLSYGMVLLACVPVAVALARRRVRSLLLAGAGGAIVVLAFLSAGFWWLDGLEVTRGEYFDGIASGRPYDYFLLSNLAALGLALGPAAAVALTRLRDTGAWLLVGGGLAAVAIAELSGMSKGEVERIWLPFVPWLLLATCALPSEPGAVRKWLGLQAAVAVTVGLLVETRW